MTRHRSATPAQDRPRGYLRRAVLPVLIAVATATAMVAVQLAVAASRDARPHFALDLALSTPVAADGETVTAVVRLTMADTKPGEQVTVAGRLTGGLRTVGADPSRGGFDVPSAVWTVPTAPGRSEAVLLWRIHAGATAPDAVEQVRVSVTSPRTRVGGVVASGSPSARPSASKSVSGSVKPPKPASPPPSSLSVMPSPTKPPGTAGPTVSPKPTAPKPTPTPIATTVKPTPTKPSAPPTPASPKPTPTLTPTKPTPTPTASTPPPPPPAPASEVDVPVAQRCADDPASACAGLRFGKPGLSLARAVDTTDARPGQTLTHTVTVADSGDAAALFANVRNSLPAGAPLLWGALSQGTYDVGTGVWQTGRIAAGGRATLTLAVRVPDPAAGTVMAARSDFVASSDPAPTVVGPCADDPDAACTSTRIAARDARSGAPIPNRDAAAGRALNNPEWGDSGARSDITQMHAD